MSSSSQAIIAFISGGLASCIAEFFTLPIDTVKVRLQVTKENEKMQVFSFSIESLLSLFDGLEAALLRQITYGSLRYGMYPLILAYVSSFISTNHQILTKFLSGLLTGIIASGLCNPTDLIKVRMQAS